MSIQEMAVENAEKRLKEIDKLDFAVSAWADYDNGLTRGFKDGAEAMLEKVYKWLDRNICQSCEYNAGNRLYTLSISKRFMPKGDFLYEFRKAMEE